jgi:hypothetical protein
VTADAAEYKAGWDAAAAGADGADAAWRASQSAELSRAATAAAEMKAGWDKAAADATEMKGEFDVQAVSSSVSPFFMCWFQT